MFRATNMLSPFEKTRLQDVLRGPRADDFVRAAARFTLDPCKSHLRDMEPALRPDDNAEMDGPSPTCRFSGRRTPTCS